MTFGAPTLILGYRRIAEGVDDPFHLCVSPERFADHLAALARRVEFVTLDEACRPSPAPRVVLTFDGGYVDTLVQALPIAQRFGAPITVYVTSGLIGEAGGHWWDRLAQIVLHGSDEPVELHLTVDGMEIPVRIGGRERAGPVLEVLWARLRRCPASEIEEVLVRLGQQLDAGTHAPPSARTMNELELRDLAASGGVAIGAQTVDDTLLRSCPYPAQLEAIRGSKVDLERCLGGSVRHFSYPFGGRDSFDRDSITAVRSAGFDTAVTAMPGSVTASSLPLALPRRMVGDWSGLLFRAKTVRYGLL